VETGERTVSAGNAQRAANPFFRPPDQSTNSSAENAMDTKTQSTLELVDILWTGGSYLY
jgi:hypothetical protein